MALELVSCMLPPPLLFSLLLLLPSAISSQQHYPKAPHGLSYQSPISFPPSAFEFFHPRALEPAAASSAPAPLPPSTLYPAATTSKARADAVVVTAGAVPEPRGHYKGSVGATAGGVAALAVGLVVAVLAAVGATYVVARRRGNVKRAKTIVQPDA